MSEAEDFYQALARSFSPHGSLTPTQIGELFRHYSLLVRWNETLNLTSVRGLEDAVVRHYCESLFLAAHLPGTPLSAIDAGSGGGFPGIPLAVLRSNCRVTLAESRQRKAVFLREATRHLPNVQVAACRFEELSMTFDWVVSRAVKWAPVLKWASGGGRASSVALLLGRDDAVAAVASGGLDRHETIPLPWGLRRVLVVGNTVPRGTIPAVPRGT
jgi:hypothetical protein